MKALKDSLKSLLLSAATLFCLSSACGAFAQPLVLGQIDGLKKAENAIQTSSGRTFVSTDGALFELKQNTAGQWTSAVVPARYTNPNQSYCYYTGLTEYAGALYGTCAESTTSGSAPKHLMALDLTQPNASWREIATLKANGFANGLAADGTGYLYYTSTALLQSGSVWRVKLSNRFTVTEEMELHKFTLCVGNGLKVHKNQLYVGVNPITFVGLSQLLRYDITPTGLTNKSVIYYSWSILDDFSLVKDGIILAEYLGQRIAHINEAGQVLRTANFSSPSSAHLINDAVAGKKVILVTEAGANRAKILSNEWGLQPRL